MKYFLPTNKRRSYTNGRDVAPCTHVCLYKQHVTLIFTRSRLSDTAQSNPFIDNYFLIIVAFLQPHFSINDILYKRKPT